MKIAVIGSGVSGLTAAHLLHKEHDISVYEAADYIGGHANTIAVKEQDRLVNIDTGFIVFNDWTYPNFEHLISELDVTVQNSEMSFSARCEGTGFEWSGGSLSTLIFNSDNWNRAIPYQILFDVFRFNKLSKKFLVECDDSLTLGSFLSKHKFSSAFIKYYILPMGAAIWSSHANQIKEYPAKSFLAFFNNHGLLNIKHRPQWKTIQQGSCKYVKELSRPFLENIKLNSPVQAIIRKQNGVIVRDKNQNSQSYDHVFIACHSDQALNMLQQPTTIEQETLAKIRYQINSAVLHTDASLMPKRHENWSSWNYWVPKNESTDVKVTYYMNKLQNLDASKDYFVTLNFDDHIDEHNVIYKTTYAHPVFDHDAIQAQQNFENLNGTQNTWYCGAYWRNGFHEDGVWSATEAVKQFKRIVNSEKLYLQRAS